METNQAFSTEQDDIYNEENLLGTQTSLDPHSTKLISEIYSLKEKNETLKAEIQKL